MKLNFPVSRHYFSVTTFEDDVLNVKTGGGNIRIYDVDRSVCDCIRLEKEIGKETVELVVENYKKEQQKESKPSFTVCGSDALWQNCPRIPRNG